MSSPRMRAATAATGLAILGGLVLTADPPGAEGVRPAAAGPASAAAVGGSAFAAETAGSIGGAARLARVAGLSDTHARADARSGGAPEDSLRLHGEFGLWARYDGDSLRVSWITRAAAPGFLEVADGPERGSSADARSFDTPPGLSHTVAFPVPEAESVVLTYGSRDDAEDRHRTRLRLDVDANWKEDAAQVRIAGVDSLFVVGDIHGEYDNMIRLLRNGGLIDDSLRWSGGGNHLVVLGDMMDRGRHATGVLWFLYRLEREAAEADGRVHIVLGNHELMVMVDDLRYVRPKELRIAQLHGTGYARMYDPRHSVLGRWLVSKPGVIQVDDVLLAHGGVSGDYGDVTLESHRDTLAAYLREDLFYHWTDTTVVIPMDSLAFERRFEFFWGDRSVFWYRGYARSDTLAHELDAVLREKGARLHVVGHTPVPSIRESYGGSLLLVNTIDFATELLLLVRGEGEYERLRYRLWGPPEPL